MIENDQKEPDETQGRTCLVENPFYSCFLKSRLTLSPRHDHVKEHVPSPHYKNKKKQHVYDRISVLDVLACPCTRDVRHSRAVTLLLLRL